MTYRDQIIALLAQGVLTHREIAQRVGCTTAYVGDVKTKEAQLEAAETAEVRLIPSTENWRWLLDTRPKGVSMPAFIESLITDARNEEFDVAMNIEHEITNVEREW